jgi:hypothetical protein
LLGAHVLGMDVHAGVDVVNQVPTRVIGVFIDYKIIAAGPAPVGGFMPVPIGDFEKESAGEPEAVTVWIKPLDAVAIGRAEMLEVAVLVGAIKVEALVARSVVAILVVVADVRDLVDVPALIALSFAIHVLVFASLGSRRNASAVAARRIGALLLSSAMLRVATMLLRVGGAGECDSQCKNESQIFIHGDTPPN